MAAKLQQVLRLDPANELTFIGPHTEIITTKLRLENPSDRVVYFKVKTTAPKHYCVRPNSGIIKPRNTAEVSVHLQPTDSPTSLDREGAKHKFMIQSAFADSDEIPIDDFWKNTSPTAVMDSKLRVLFNLHAPAINIPATASKEGAAVTTPAVPTQVPKAKELTSDSKDSELRKRIDNEKKLERDNRELREEIARLNRISQNASTEVGLPMMQVYLIAFAALLIGLILGKMF
uniref:Major sperm protein n=1 Tax=Panagrolaimus sp. JU765 TaxID=591449 RepID=A0AC34QZJ3_9BILA